ncbi:hypothetical protein Glove_227g120 [Diversispora epigaea]|uniref:Uncharacterized protein n=1 Tax=Diversispora epigaea TaxID=1348612 RepID=A0A397IIY7_9GLOM|nr:hypothetical protein Glove_227g120 [Diversispora epigaea]
MSNDQLTINTLKELNSRFVSEITKLRKENVEILELKKKFSKVEAENIKLRVENVKLKQALEEYEFRFVKLEQNDKNTAIENSELKVRVAKLKQKQLQTDEKNNFIVKSDDYVIHVVKTIKLSQMQLKLKKIEVKLVLTTCIDYIKGINQFSVNIISTEMENSNDIHKQIDLRCDNTPAFNISNNTSNSDELNNTSNSDVSDNAFSELSENTNPVIDQAQNTEIKISYNKRVEQDLRHDLSVFIKENNNKINNVFDIQILEFSLEVIIIGSTKVTAQNMVNLFILAIKVRQKEILSKTLIYNKIKALFPNINDVNLCQRIFRVKKIYTLLIEIEIEKIQAITCSVNTISKIIDITNYNVQVIELFNSNDISTTKSYTSNLEDHINEDVKSLFNDDEKNIDNTNNNDKYDNEMNLKDLTKVNTIYNHTYFCSKLEKQYPDLFWEGRDENNDYYGITDEFLCLLYKSDHYEDKDYIIKISKFPEEKDSETKYLIYNKIHTHRGIWAIGESVLNKSHETEFCSPTHLNKNCLYQYIIEHKIDSEKFESLLRLRKKDGIENIFTKIWKEIYVFIMEE